MVFSCAPTDWTSQTVLVLLLLKEKCHLQVVSGILEYATPQSIWTVAVSKAASALLEKDPVTSSGSIGGSATSTFVTDDIFLFFFQTTKTTLKQNDQSFHNNSPFLWEKVYQRF